MKKQVSVMKKDNVILFPNLEKRLTEKGLESLQEKRYIEAIDFLEDARELDPVSEDILIGLVLAYFESSQFQNAKKLAKEMLLKGIGDYMKLVELYLTILIQLHEYSEIVATIEVLMEEKEIPPDKQEHFLKILQFSMRMTKDDRAHEDSTEIQGTELDVQNDELNLLEITDSKEQMLLVSRLTGKNILPYIQEITDYLRTGSGHPFFKTMLLNLLREQEYEQEVVVHKFNLESEFIPKDLPEIRSQVRMGTIIEILKGQLESSDPVLLSNIQNLVERHFLMVYPFSLEPLNANAWAAAFHCIALEYHGFQPVMNDFSQQYGCAIKDIENSIASIKQIEEISSPII